MIPPFIHRYRMTLRHAGNARAAALVREGFLIRCAGGFGCVQPWPELGDPTVDELLRILGREEHHPLTGLALFCAINDGFARSCGSSIFDGLTIPASHATITGDAGFPALAAAGFHTVKLKSHGEDAGLVDRVAQAAAAGLKIRIDFNGTGHSAILTALRPWAESIDFIEDPVPYEPVRWRELQSLTNFRLALDRLPDTMDCGGYDVRVLKPALEPLHPRMEEVVITSCMDHPLGQMFAAWAAATYQGRQLEAGLLTHTLYEPDAFTEAVFARGPSLLPPSGTGLGFDHLLEALPWKKFAGPVSIQVPEISAGDFPPLESPAFWQSREPLLFTNPRTPLIDPPAGLPDNCLVFATSGSTGSPSLICLTRESLLASAAAVNAWLNATPDDVWLRVLPYFHVGGMGIHARASLTGSRVVCDHEKWNPSRFVQLVTGSGVTLTSLVPAQVHDLVSGGYASPACLRTAIIGGGALDQTLLEKARTLGWPLLPSYGLTEAASQVATARPGTFDSPPLLELLPCWEARLSADGRLQLRGAPLATGKLVRTSTGWELQPVADTDGWFTTADRASLHGRVLSISGRSDRVIKVLGELVDLDAVEATLSTAGLPPGRGLVLPRPDARAGLRPWLVTDLPIPEASALITRANASLPPFAALAGSEQIPELPRSALGKILRADVAAAPRGRVTPAS